MLITEYMKKFISISLFISACFLGSCSSYDDERIWQDLNEIEKTIGDLSLIHISEPTRLSRNIDQANDFTV